MLKYHFFFHQCTGHSFLFFLVFSSIVERITYHVQENLKQLTKQTARGWGWGAFIFVRLIATPTPSRFRVEKIERLAL